ncbi:SEL1-like repeat protein [Streptomyces paradoxus]|uniref:SEL1-like repeat protein n=1 Tax=Streptomyces paradoxus TaxID=66375 RepID=UPI001C856489|nr:sel1 repeat family protein [Streptomyces paradoxus]
MTALAGALRLPAGDRQELEKMQRVAAGGGDAERPGPGRPIGQCDPHALEVHPVGTVRDGSGLPGQRLLPGYVFREHDRILTEAAREAREGYSRMVVLVGESSTGKTRACWEAVQPLAEQGWRLWHPFDPTRAEAAVEDLDLVGPRTVVWLNEAQHYLGDRAGERIAAAVHHLLTSPQRGPVLVLGTLWPDYFRQYTALPAPGGPDPHSRVRELLAGCTVSVPDSFDSRALAAATALAEGGDRLLADSLTRARADGRLTQDLAGGPALLKRYHAGSPAAKALLEVAMDARRLGVGLHLPQAFLTDAAPDYLHDTDWMQLTDDWAEKAYAELAEQVHGNQAPLSRVTPRPQRRPPGPSTPADAPSPQPSGPVFRLADYLEQYGRTTRRHLCPPASFWHAAHTHLAHPDDLYNLTSEALDRHRLQWAHHLQLRAAHCGNTDALCALARMREKAGDREGAETLYRQAADRGNADALYALAQMREKAGDREGAETLARQADDHGFPSAMSRLVGMQENAMSHLVGMREKAGDRVGAETLARQAADRGNTDALYALAQMRENAGDREGAETLYRQAADQGNTSAVCRLVEMREEAGDREDAETLARQAADHGNTNALLRLARTREWAGDREGAETLARQAANHGNTNALYALAFMREWAGDREGAETLFRQAADHGNTDALYGLARMREWAGDREDAEALFRQAADHGNFNALVRLARIRVSPGTREDGDETLAQHAADHGNTDAPARLTWMHEWALTEALLQRKVRDGEGDVALARRAAEGDTSALVRLAQIRERAGDREDAGALYRQAADHGHTDALYRLAQIRERAGDWEGAEALYRQAADHGHTDALYDLAQIRERVGDWEGAEALYRQAADHGDAQALLGMAMALKRLWPYGLDPDGTPTPEWQ